MGVRDLKEHWCGQTLQSKSSIVRERSPNKWASERKRWFSSQENTSLFLPSRESRSCDWWCERLRIDDESIFNHQWKRSCYLWILTVRELRSMHCRCCQQAGTGFLALNDSKGNCDLGNRTEVPLFHPYLADFEGGKLRHRTGSGGEHLELPRGWWRYGHRANRSTTIKGEYLWVIFK